ncbi:MAG: hypothetical protein LBG62_05970 [Candidatus Methanoplasma sp.]|jgi:hypothetical protein|nr:hypothetical protein [Candidatus Methanoplasma sp.]
MRPESKKHILLCASVFLSASVYFVAEKDIAIDRSHDVDDGWILGVAYDLRESPRGFVFSLERTDGSSMRCFSFDEIEAGRACEVRGEWSADGGMFFVRSHRLLEL